jgi:nicotinamide mononucleotide transporter PnuC
MSWILSNYIEIVGFLFGLLFLYLEIKENTWIWPVGIITAIFYVVIFFQAKLYANMGIQFYYIVISIYGWYKWMRGGGEHEPDLPIINVSVKVVLNMLWIWAILFVGIAELLKHLTESPVPYWDSFTTSLSIVGTWMLTRKYLEVWWVWIVVNLVTTVMLIYRELYPSAILFFIYFVMSFVGYFSWRKSKLKQKMQENGEV